MHESGEIRSGARRGAKLIRWLLLSVVVSSGNAKHAARYLCLRGGRNAIAQRNAKKEQREKGKELGELAVIQVHRLQSRTLTFYRLLNASDVVKHLGKRYQTSRIVLCRVPIVRAGFAHGVVLRRYRNFVLQGTIVLSSVIWRIIQSDVKIVKTSL